MLLSGCSNKEPEVVVPPVSEQLSKVEMLVYSVTAFGQYSGYVKTGDELTIYPYYNLDKSIDVKMLTKSSNTLLASVLKSVPSEQVLKREYYTLFTYNGVSYGYMDIDSGTAVVASSSDLGLGYIDVLMRHTYAN